MSSTLPVIGATDLMDGKSGFVHTVLWTSELCQVWTASSQHSLANIIEAQTQIPVIINQGVGAAQ